MVAEWYYRKGEQEHGPIESKALLHLAQTGGLRSEDLVRKQGMKAGIPAAKVKGLVFPTTPQLALQPEAVHRPPPLKVSTPAAVPEEAVPAKSNVDWSSAFLLSIAFVLSAPLVFAVLLLLFVFAPIVLFLIPVAAAVFCFAGPKKYRSRLGSFWKTLGTPRYWRLTTTGAAFGIAAGVLLTFVLAVTFSRALDKKEIGSPTSHSGRPTGDRAVVVPAREPTQQTVQQKQVRSVEFAGLTLGCSASDALKAYGDPEVVKKQEDSAVNQTYIELSGNPQVKNVKRTRLWFLDDRLYYAELEIRTHEEGAAGTEGQAWVSVLGQKYGDGKAEQDTDYVPISGRMVPKILLIYVFTPSPDVTVTLKLPLITVRNEALVAACSSRREQSERAAAKAKQFQAEEKIKSSGF